MAKIWITPAPVRGGSDVDGEKSFGTVALARLGTDAEWADFAGGLQETSRVVVAEPPADGPQKQRGADGVDAEPGEVEHDVPDDCVVEIMEADGFVHWVHVEDLPRRRNGDYTLPDPPYRAIQGQRRSARGLVRRIVRFFAVKAGSTIALQALVERAEEKQLAGVFESGAATERSAAGHLVQVNPTGALSKLAARHQEVGPWLLFIHGTGSNFAGAFDGLIGTEADGEQPAITQLARTYHAMTPAAPPRLLAFEHRTLTRSPTENARALAEAIAAALPTNAEIHIVSHSRGGLVGELLAIAADRTAVVARGLVDDINAIRSHLGARTVTRFVRVACPARGTILASHRLDRTMTVIANGLKSLAKLAGPIVGALAEIAAGIAIAVTAKRKDPHDFPGLEAMMPTSAFVGNLAASKTTAPLVPIGTAHRVRDSDRFGASILSIATDLFYREPHDLVVHLAAMDGGANRGWVLQGTTISQKIVGGDVTHFTYFSNAASRGIVLDALFDEMQRRTVASTDESRRGMLAIAFRWGRLPYTPVDDRVPAVRQSTVSGSKIVIIVPGFPGSELSLRQGTGRAEVVWLDKSELFLRGLTRLEVSEGGVSGVGPSDILPGAYHKLAQALDKSARVVTFGYDWRLGVSAAAASLAELVARLNDQPRAPKPSITLVGHSTGGLVIDCALSEVKLQKQVAGVAYLGTPHKGTWAAYEALRGLPGNWMARAARLSPGVDRGDIERAAGTFQTLFDLLPTDAELQSCFQRTFGDNWTRAEPSRKTTWNRIAAGAEALVPRINILGTDRHTPAYAIDAAGTLVPDKEQPGDGTVLDSSAGAVHASAATAYANSTHTGLTEDRAVHATIASFAGVAHSRRGESAATSSPQGLAMAGLAHCRPEPPVDTGRRRVDDENLPYLPRDSAELSRWILDVPPAYDDEASTQIRVRVAHGNLRHARWPVIVGQIAEDAIRGAQAEIDALYGRQLSRMRALAARRYPSAVGTAQYFKRSSERREAAVVVGLGKLGTITEESVRRAMESGLLEIARNIDRRSPNRDLGASVVLVGSVVSSDDVPMSVSAILTSVRSANAKLREVDRERPFAFRDIEIIELWSLRAARALRTIQRIRQFEGQRSGFAIDGAVATLEGGRNGQPPPSAGMEGWVVLRVDAPDGPPRGAPERMACEGALWKQTLIGGAAAAVEDAVVVNAGVLRAIDAVGTGRAIAAREDAGQALFNLLVAPRYKPMLAQGSNLRIVVSPAAASMPWEFMRPEPEDEADAPWGVTTPIIRTLALPPEEMEQGAACKPRTALLIGNPDLGGVAATWHGLPGAESEVRSAASALDSWPEADVRALVHRPADENLRALYSMRPQVLHLATHGVVSCDDQAECAGVLVGGESGAGATEVWLTSAAIRQLPSVPDLVVLNCCEVGYIGTGSTLVGRRKSAVTAVSLAEAFMSAGCRALVAAAWSIDDTAATAFSEALYTNMVAGRSFGEATRAARRAAWETNPGDDTWGAYQVYGDPEFRLWFRDEAPASTSTARDTPLVAEEAIMEFDRITHGSAFAYVAGVEAERRAGWGHLVDRHRGEARVLWNRLPAELASNLRVAGAAASCFAELLDWDWAEPLLRAMVRPGSADSTATPAPVELKHLDEVRAEARFDGARVRGLQTQDLANITVRLITANVLGRRPRPVGAPRPSDADFERFESARRAADVLLGAPGDRSEEQECLVAGALWRKARFDMALGPTPSRTDDISEGDRLARQEQAARVARTLGEVERVYAAVNERPGARHSVRCLTSSLGFRWLEMLVRHSADIADPTTSTYRRKKPADRFNEARAHLIEQIAHAGRLQAAEESGHETTVWWRMRELELRVIRGWVHGSLVSDGLEDDALPGLLVGHREAYELGISPRAADSVAARVCLYAEVARFVEPALDTHVWLKPFVDGVASVFTKLHDDIAPPYPQPSPAP